MRVGLNLLYAHPRIGGAWNYIGDLVEAISRCDQSNEYIAYVHDASLCLVPKLPNFQSRLFHVDGNKRVGRVIAEQLLLPWHARRDRLDLMHWFGNVSSFLPSPAESVVTITDLRSFEKRDSYDFFFRDLYIRALMPQTVRRASRLFPMSQATGDSIHRWFPDVANKTRVVLTPIREVFRKPLDKDVEAFRLRRKLPEKYWLYVSHYYSHKNHKRLFEAYGFLCRKNPDTWPLVLCGAKNGADDTLNQWMGEAGVADRVIWLSGLSGEEMPLLYGGAGALVFASEFEGGGIPVMEAMACECPVLVSNIPALVEAAGDAAILFDPLRPQSIADAMLRFESDPELRAQLVERGRRRIERQRPERIAADLIDIYESIGAPMPAQAFARK